MQRSLRASEADECSVTRARVADKAHASVRVAGGFEKAHRDRKKFFSAARALKKAYH